MKFIKTFICFLFASSLSGQVNDILKNKDISWAAEFEIDFIVDNIDSMEKADLNILTTLKKLNTNGQYTINLFLTVKRKNNDIPQYF